MTAPVESTTEIVRKKQRLATRHWLHGLAGALVGGGASAVVSWAGLGAAQAVGVHVATLDLRQLGVIFLSSGLVAGFAYLKQSPLPPEVTRESVR